VAVGEHPHDRALEAAHLADVAGRADRDVQAAVRAEAGVAPAVVAKVGQDPRRQHDLALARWTEPADLILLDDEQGAVGSEREAVRRFQAACDLHNLVGDAVALRIERRQYLVAAGPHVDPGAFLGDRERARARHLCEDPDREASRHVEALERQLRPACARNQVSRQSGGDGEAAGVLGSHGPDPAG
jgi:hypothetical protein